MSDSVEAQLQDAGEAYLVDPKFKEQFEIAHPTERYSELLDELPAFFVGTEDRLVTLVELLCSEMSVAFQTTGVFLPRSSHGEAYLLWAGAGQRCQYEFSHTIRVQRPLSSMR